jgi:hypothetical protein
MNGISSLARCGTRRRHAIGEMIAKGDCRMLISWNKKFIYIKTNKTASTSIEMALQPFCQLDRYSRIEEKTHSIVSDAGIIG